MFKGKKKNAYKEALKRKGKIRMELWFDDNEVHEVSVSHTKVTLPYNKKDYELIFVYCLVKWQEELEKYFHLPIQE